MTSDAVARTKADPNRSFREDALVEEIERLHAALEALTARAFKRCLFPKEVKAALEVLRVQ
jgi:hypothetical protein